MENELPPPPEMFVHQPIRPPIPVRTAFPAGLPFRNNSCRNFASPSLGILVTTRRTSDKKPVFRGLVSPCGTRITQKRRTGVLETVGGRPSAGPARKYGYVRLRDQSGDIGHVLKSKSVTALRRDLVGLSTTRPSLAFADRKRSESGTRLWPIASLNEHRQSCPKLHAKSRNDSPSSAVLRGPGGKAVILSTLRQQQRLTGPRHSLAPPRRFLANPKAASPPARSSVRPNSYYQNNFTTLANTGKLHGFVHFPISALLEPSRGGPKTPEKHNRLKPLDVKQSVARLSRTFYEPWGSATEPRIAVSSFARDTEAGRRRERLERLRRARRYIRRLRNCSLSLEKLARLRPPHEFAFADPAVPRSTHPRLLPQPSLCLVSHLSAMQC